MRNDIKLRTEIRKTSQLHTIVLQGNKISDYSHDNSTVRSVLIP